MNTGDSQESEPLTPDTLWICDTYRRYWSKGEVGHETHTACARRIVYAVFT